MRILVLDAALARSAVAVVAGGVLVAQRLAPGGRGHPAALAPMVCDVCIEAGLAPSQMDAVAVTVGPGSFTGLRAAMSLAYGLAAAAGCRVVAVTVPEGIAEAVKDEFPHRDGRALWVAIDNRRGRVFLQRPDLPLEAVPLDALPPVNGRVALAGDAAGTVAAWLAGRGDDVMLTRVRLPAPRDIARAALHRLEGFLPPLDVQPLYVDPPEAKLPAGGLRPAPVG